MLHLSPGQVVPLILGRQLLATTSSPTVPAVHKPSIAVRTALLIIFLPVVIGLMLFAFMAPTHASGPKDVPIAISAPQAVIDNIESTLAENSDNAPEIIVANDDAAVRELIHDREAVGGLTVSAEGATVYTASGNGAAYVQMMNTLGGNLTAAGQQITTVDLAPTSAEDPQATGIALLGLPLAFGGIVSAVTATLLLKGHKGLTVSALAGIALVAGLVVTFLLHNVYGTLTGNFWAEFAAVSLGISATSFVAAGLAVILRVPGIGITALLTIFVSNPLSGLATGPWLLPSGWSTLGQLMPIGATGHIIRSISFFGGGGIGNAFLVPICWVLVGATLILAVRRRKA